MLDETLEVAFVWLTLILSIESTMEVSLSSDEEVLIEVDFGDGLAAARFDGDVKLVRFEDRFEDRAPINGLDGDVRLLLTAAARKLFMI